MDKFKKKSLNLAEKYPPKENTIGYVRKVYLDCDKHGKYRYWIMGKLVNGKLVELPVSDEDKKCPNCRSRQKIWRKMRDDILKKL